MSKYLVNKFLFTVDRDADLMERYREDPRGTVTWWERERANLVEPDLVDVDLRPGDRTQPGQVRGPQRLHGNICGRHVRPATSGACTWTGRTRAT